MGVAGAAARLIALAALCAACAHGRASPPSTPPGGIVHRVGAGETLWRISHAYGVPIQAVVRENALEDPAQLEAGTMLFIPGATQAVTVPPVPESAPAASQSRPRRGPASIPRAGARPLDPAVRGEPLLWPVRGVLISGFGARERDQHDGIDLACPEGTPVQAAGEGVVLFAGEQRGYGKLVVIAHDNDLVTVYAHNSENLVDRGDKVSRGAEIARVGHTGNATGPHVHFEVRVGTRPRDPLGFLR